MSADLEARAPKYQRVADQLRQEIRSGRWGLRDRLPAETALVERFRVSLPTVRQAIGVLRAEGLVESRHGIGPSSRTAGVSNDARATATAVHDLIGGS